MRGRRLLLGVLLVALCAPEAAAAAAPVKSLPGSDGANVVIRRTAHGIPHILGKSFRDVGYGYGYAFAEDNICTIAAEYVTVRAQRSLFFGAENNWEFEGNGSTVNNLNSDFFFKRIIDKGTVESLLSRPPPNGPRSEVREGVSGYVAGYNRYLRDTGVENIPDSTCRGEEWVRPITEIDVYRYFYELALLASSGVAIDGIAGAQPPTPALPLGSAPRVNEPKTAEQMDLIRSNLDRFQLGGLGSNAYGLGRESTVDGSGMVLGNPHFPWDGAQRFYQSHLTVPGKADVAGASLFGVPIILIGHTQNLAWSHTVSTARRFTPFELKLVPGSPTSYVYDGEVRQMDADTVTVQVRGEGGAPEGRTRTLYSTVHGPILVSIAGLPLFPWSSAQAHALGDANAANFRYLNHFLETNMAQSVREYDAIQRRNQGIPWVNSIAADSTGEAYYADIGVVPNVSDAKASECNSALGTQTFDLLGIPILDGSRSECRWDNDPDAIQPGTFGPSNQPSMFRDDYVTNSNDSYWLTNPEQPLEGFARIIGDERTARTLRTRLGLKIVQQQGRFRLHNVQDAVFNNRQHAGELFRDALVELCRSNPVLTGTRGPVDVSEACPVLAAWDLRDDLDSRGAVLFRRFATKVLGGTAGGTGVYTTPFDVNDPVNTPRGLNTDSPTVRSGLADAVDELRDLGIPLDARLREYQYEPRGEERIPIHGGPGGLGVFNAISAPFEGSEGFPDIVHGSSFVMAAHMDGSRCPESRSILTYSQSANPESPYFADQTRAYSNKRWVDMRFCTEEILRARALRVTELGCVADAALRLTRVRALGRRRVELTVRPRPRRAPATIELLRARPAGLQRLARKQGSLGFKLTRRLPAGRYVGRFTGIGRTGKAEVREVGFVVRRAGAGTRASGRVRVLRPGFSERRSCGALASATLGSPVFGGRADRPLRVRYRLGRRARVSVTVRRGGRVRHARAGVRSAGAYAVTFGSARLARGAYRVRVVARSGKRRRAVTLAARRR